MSICNVTKIGAVEFMSGLLMRALVAVALLSVFLSATESHAQGIPQSPLGLTKYTSAASNLVTARVDRQIVTMTNSNGTIVTSTSYHNIGTVALTPTQFTYITTFYYPPTSAGQPPVPYYVSSTFYTGHSGSILAPTNSDYAVTYKVYDQFGIILPNEVELRNQRN